MTNFKKKDELKYFKFDIEEEKNLEINKTRYLFPRTKIIL